MNVKVKFNVISSVSNVKQCHIYIIYAYTRRASEWITGTARSLRKTYAFKNRG